MLIIWQHHLGNLAFICKPKTKNLNKNRKNRKLYAHSTFQALLQAAKKHKLIQFDNICGVDIFVIYRELVIHFIEFLHKIPHLFCVEHISQNG